MSLLKTHDTFIQEIKQTHPDLKVLGIYVNSKTKILLEDKIGIQYLFRPNDLLKGAKPSINSAVDKNLAFKIKAEQIHGKSSYDYSEVEYITNKIKINIFCNICMNHFLQKPTRHLSGDGCPNCGFIKSQKSNKEILNQRTHTIIDDITKKHDNRINCDKLIYKGSKVKSIFGCNVNPEHGYWKATPNDILDGSGCPFCNSSKGEIKIESFLKSNNLYYEKNKTFPGCKYKSLLRFDFYLPNHNICIEYDGIQHFKSIYNFGGEKTFKENQLRDKIKNDFCKKTNIKLVRISYIDFNNIESIISQLI